MTIEIIVLYFIIAFVLSVVSAYYEYCNFYSHEDIETYFDTDFSLPAHICMWIFWPITLIVLFIMVFIPNIYMIAVILLDKIFGGKKK